MNTAEPVLITSPSFSHSKELIRDLEALGFAPIANTDGRKLVGKDLIAFLNQHQARIAIVGTEKITVDILAATPSLRFIAKYGVGLDNIDQTALERQGIGLGWTPGVNKRSVAELVMAIGFGHFRQIIPGVRRMLDGQWLKNGGRQLSNTTLGIVGLGNTGGELATLCSPLVKEIVYFDIDRKTVFEAQHRITYSSYEDLLKRCDWVSFHVPLTPLTENMLDSEMLKHVKPGCLIVNASRGEVLDFPLLIQALKAEAIGGFACDVYTNEPFDASAWKDLYNFYPTPHIGGNSSEAIQAMGTAAIEHVKRFASVGH